MSDSLRPHGLAYQASQFMEFSRQEYWSGLPFPSPWDLPDPGIQPMSLKSPALTGGFFATSATWEAPWNTVYASILNRHPWYSVNYLYKIQPVFLRSPRIPMSGILNSKSDIAAPGNNWQCVESFWSSFVSLSSLPFVFHVTVAVYYYEQERVAIQAGQILGLIHEGEDQDRQTQKSEIADKGTHTNTEAVISLCLVALRADPSARGIRPFAYAPW